MIHKSNPEQLHVFKAPREVDPQVQSETTPLGKALRVDNQQVWCLRPTGRNLGTFQSQSKKKPNNFWTNKAILMAF